MYVFMQFLISNICVAKVAPHVNRFVPRNNTESRVTLYLCNHENLRGHKTQFRSVGISWNLCLHNMHPMHNFVFLFRVF